jgi:hypothetical protein
MVTRQVINGFRIRGIDILDIPQEELQLVVTLSVVTVTITLRNYEQ